MSIIKNINGQNVDISAEKVVWIEGCLIMSFVDGFPTIIGLVENYFDEDED